MKPILIPFPITRYLPPEYQNQPGRGPKGLPNAFEVTLCGFPSDEVRIGVSYFRDAPEADAELSNRHGIIVIDAGARILKARSIRPIGDGAYEWIRDVLACYRAFVALTVGGRIRSENARFTSVALEDFWEQDGELFRPLLRHAPAP